MALAHGQSHIGAAATAKAAMPIYEFECEECGSRFDELVAADASPPPCPRCASVQVRRLFSDVAPPGRQPRGAGSAPTNRAAASAKPATASGWRATWPSGRRAKQP